MIRHRSLELVSHYYKHMVLLLAAQKPGVNITAQNGRVAAGNITEYVKVGRSFEVSCDSTGNYKGRITWMKKSGTSMCKVPLAKL